PSLFQSSTPSPLAEALKKSWSLYAVRNDGPEVPAPGTMSATRSVPAPVPSVFHTSLPNPLTFTVKNSVSPTTVVSSGNPFGKLFKRTVPAVVPSVFQAADCVINNVFAPTFFGRPRSSPVYVMSTVPASVPSLLQSPSAMPSKAPKTQ